MEKNEITVVKTYGVETLDKAIADGLTALSSAESSNKNVALAMATLRTAQKDCERTAKFKFPVWVESVYNCRISGQSMYKYAQIALAFSGSEYWDVFSLSKLSILMNARTKDIKDAPGAVDALASWYGDTINCKQLDRHALWEAESESILSHIASAESAGDAATADVWREKLKPEPKDGVTVPEFGDKDATAKYVDLCTEVALNHFVKLHDSELASIVKAYRDPDNWFINDSGLGEKYTSAEGVADSTDSTDSTDSAPKTPEELKAEAYAALLAYVGSGVDNKTLNNALRILGSRD